MAVPVELARDPIRLDVAFRGGRSYLHSTSIFAAILGHLRNPRAIRFVIRRMAHQGLMLAGDTDGRDVIGEFRCVDDGIPVRLHLCVDPDAAPPPRGPSNEAEIIGRSVLVGDCVSGAIGRPGSFIETVVDLHKHLIQSTAPTDRKLLFSELTTSRVPQSGTVTIGQLVRLGARMFRSRVSHDGDPLGNIVFMGADP